MDRSAAHAKYLKLLDRLERLQPLADSLEEQGAALNEEIRRGLDLGNRGRLRDLQEIMSRHMTVREIIFETNCDVWEMEKNYQFAYWRVPKANSNPPVLKGVTLAAIVRDEIMNPAGGIVGFINATVPYVEKALFLDTGSSDRTRDVLRCAAANFDNIEVFRAYWKGFSQARNDLMGEVKTERVLILDADEILADEFWSTVRGFEYLSRELGKHPSNTRLEIPVKEIYADSDKVIRTENAINPRIILAEDWFQVHDKRRDYNEFVNTQGDGGVRVRSPVSVYHFKPGVIPAQLKERYYYDTGMFMMDPPAKSAKELGWKQMNRKALLMRH